MTNLVASVAANIIKIIIAHRPIHVLHAMYSISINSVIYMNKRGDIYIHAKQKHLGCKKVQEVLKVAK